MKNFGFAMVRYGSPQALDFGLGRRTMHKTLRFGSFSGNNLKSKIQNQKWLGLSVIAFVLMVAGTVAQARQAKQVPRIGVMHSGSKSDVSDKAFRQGLRDLGYTEGKNIVVEYRYAEGKLERFPDFAAELVRIQVDIVVTSSDPGARAAKNATNTIPIVILGVGSDPVETGLVESYARPGGNITGLTIVALETAGKRLELLKDAVPKLARVAVLYDSANRGNLLHVKEVQTAGRTLGVTVQPWEIRGTDGFETVFTTLSKERPDGLYVTGGPRMNANEKQIAGFENRLPSTYNRRESVDAGGLMCYGVDRVDHYRRGAYYVDKILKGTKPADLPVERPTKFEFVINLKTAKQIGLAIPQSVLYRADKVIR
jgi:putative ABC transport system substrate-binding protein